LKLGAKLHCRNHICFTQKCVFQSLTQRLIFLLQRKREPTMPRRSLKVVGNHLHRCNNSSPRYARENHYAILVRFLNFLRSQTTR